MKSGRFGITVIGALISLAVLLAVVGPKLVEKPPARVPAAAAPGTKEEGVTARGVVESAQDVVLSSQVNGTVVRMLAEEGATVHQGELLLEFDRSKVEAQLGQARSALSAAAARYREAVAGYRPEDILVVQSARERAQAIYDHAKDECERQQRLFDQGAATLVELNRAQERLKVARDDLSGADANLSKHRSGLRSEARDQARADLERARAELQMVESVLKDYRVYAPVSGIITERHKSRGESADVGAPLFRIINPQTFRIRAELEETDIGKVTEGQKVAVTVEAFRDKVYAGKVTQVFPVVHKKSQKSFDPLASFDINTQKIDISLDAYSGLRSGMTTTVRFK